MILDLREKPLQSETELLERCDAVAGLSFAQLATFLAQPIPLTANQRKGWVGLALEHALGTTAGTKALPDFIQLGIEMKTIPLNETGKPAESTFVTSIPLLTIHQETWETSVCYHKLKRVLWVPIESSENIPFPQRRIGAPFLWSPNKAEELVLRQDWQLLVDMICTGHLEEVTAALGQYLQIRPKAAHAKSLCYGFDALGNKSLTLPRGFYLRSLFTQTLFS